ncbi:restriction endonuclease subunit S [Bacteroides thetaiotaomicron]|uniref:restriction endonuclease subunit S n=1 Tax=Bacteroides TaxID=816 RepID=UPI000E71A6FD|nr:MULTISPECIES: restriction endonuclease subunit S [Bacteroides]RJU22434.1 restriction endonuclease subunit S [Bacteroides sp. AF37-16AC]UYU79584.1 restriction endonuclease subunit S [Bacteroides thetaiotaomicron]
MSQFIEMFGNPVTNTKGWKTAKIKDVAPEMPSKEQLSGKIWLLNLDMIESNTGRIIEKVYEDVENALSVQSFDEGNVLFSKLRPYLNKVVIPDEPGMATTELVPLRPEPSKLHKVFLSHMLRGNQFVNYANDIAGGTKMPRMPLTELRNFDCILPPMDKQLEFVFIAEQADKSKFGDFKSQFIEMFGDPMTNTKAWVEFGYIGNYTQIVLGTTPNSKNSSYWNGEIKWITPAEMTEESYYIYDTERHLTEEGLKAANLTLLPCRSVLFSTRAPIGKVGLVGSPMYCNQGFKNFVCGDQLNPVYLYYSLIFKREYLVSLGTGTTFKELSKKAVENLKIAVPPLILQNKFEEIYQQADKSKSVIQKALVYLNDIQSDELGKIA